MAYRLNSESVEVAVSRIVGDRARSHWSSRNWVEWRWKFVPFAPGLSRLYVPRMTVQPE